MPMQKLFFTAAVAMATVALASGSIAQSVDEKTPVQEESYKAGLDCFEQLDFSCAIDLLTAAAYSTKPDQTEKWCDIYSKLAQSHLALGQQELAVEDFSKLLKGVPNFEISAPGTSPKILEALKEARRHIKNSSRQAPGQSDQGFDKKEKTVNISSTTSVDLSLKAGVQFLVGQDHRMLDTGPVFDLELIYAYSGPWLMGGGIRWSLHGVSSDDHWLQMLNAWAGGGFSVPAGPVDLYAMLCMGGGWFGISGSDDRWAMVIPLKLGAGWKVSQRWEIGLEFTPSWVLTFGDFLSSLTFDVSACTSVSF